MAGKKAVESDKQFIVAQLRDIVESGDCDAVSLGIRLQALDRLAMVTDVYTVEKVAA